MSRILIVEDDDKVRRALKKGLEEQGYQVVAVDDGFEGLRCATSERFDCVVLDVMLPSRDGFQILDDIRAADVRVPTLMLTARRTIEDRVRGLDAGADDYVTKPFVWAEFLARVRACIRRGMSEPRIVLRAGRLELDCLRRCLVLADRQIALTPRELELLEYFARHQGETVTRDQLARDVWRDPLTSMTNVIDVYVNYLRKKLERAGEGHTLKTVRGTGFRFEVR